MVSRDLVRSSLPVLLSGLMLAACGGAPENGLAPSEEALGTREDSLCAGASVSSLTILDFSSYDGVAAGYGEWAVTYPANTIHLDYYVDGVLRAVQELRSDTRSGIWNFSYSPVSCGPHTFEVKAYPMIIDSLNNVTHCPTSGNKTRTQSFANACPDMFIWPKRANQYGQQDEIWKTTTNGNRFCQEEGYASMASYTVGCGEDESSYVTFDGTRWVAQSSGSKNQCYDIFSSITCQ